MPTLDEMRRRFAAGSEPEPEQERFAVGVSVDSLEPFYKSAVATVILGGVATALPGATKHAMRAVVTYRGRDWSVRPEINDALLDAVSFMVPARKPTVDEAKTRAALQIPIATKRIKEAANALDAKGIPGKPLKSVDDDSS